MEALDDANQRWTFLLLLILAALTFLLPLVTTPVVCDAQSRNFESRRVNFAHAECSYAGQHLEIFDKEIHGLGKLARTSQPPLSMMTWTPYILTMMAIAMKIPYFIWSQLSTWRGLNVETTVRELIRLIHAHRTEFLTEAIRALCMLLRHKGNSASMVLVLVRKTLTTFLLMAVFLTIHLWIDPFPYTTGSTAPEQTIGSLRSHSNCVYTLKNEQDFEAKFSVTCIYPTNLVLQKLFIFLGVYTACLTLANVLDLMMWVRMLFTLDSQTKALADYIHSYEKVTGRNTRGALLDRNFISFLGFDGLLLLKIINNRLGEFAWADIGVLLWYEYQVITNAEVHAHLSAVPNDASCSTDGRPEGKVDSCPYESLTNL